ncbi:MAG: DNA mismatch repair endonuclease MutL [Thermodesulfobacteriota bacterium]|nr:DNA mismatch repair endonuclease MutL [Thermodesulfobacteriota bacterium]
MNRIRVLPENVSSQIAAGEVIDRPASVVKELIDNSVDAGADRIIINVEKGGKQLIKVSDNGVGMSRDDLLLCVERHATSKIETASDLFSIKSLGFRGEALPSMASVSRMRIISRPKDQIAGHRLKIAGGKMIAIEEMGSPTGTIVEVGELFYSVPARRKFLRAAKTETDHIIDILSRSVLPLPGVQFRLDDAGKMIMNLPASDEQLPRLSGLMGRQVAESMVEAVEKNHDLRIRAYLGPSELSRSRGDRLFVYVNNRNIRDRLVTKAIMEGYAQRLMKGQYPQAVVFIEIDPSKVDVNVHPAKQEVRFHDGAVVYQALVSTISKALVRTFYGPIDKVDERDRWGLDRKDSLSFMAEKPRDYFKPVKGKSASAGAEMRVNSIVAGGPQIIGQLGNTYILCQVEDGLIMVDQHAAHERIVYENLKKVSHNSQIENQALLIPHEVELTLKEKRVVMGNGDRLSRFGIELDHFGGNTFLLRSVPAPLKDLKWDSLISELLTDLEEGGPEDTVFDKALTAMACHGAIRAGHRLTHEEMAELLNQLEGMDLPENCPHGRPVFKRLTYYEIAKMFKRIV